MNNIKKIYQYAGKCYNQQNLRDILDDAMVSTTEEITYDGPILPMTSAPVKNQVLGKNCVFSLTYLMLKRKQQNVLLELQNQNTDP